MEGYQVTFKMEGPLSHQDHGCRREHALRGYLTWDGGSHTHREFEKGLGRRTHYERTRE